jgi:hypothetical protein
MNVGQAPRQIEDGETCGRANAFIALQNTSTDVIDNIVHSEKYCTRSQHDNLGLERAAVVADIGPAPLPHEHRQRTAGPIDQPRLGVQRCAVVSIERFVPRIVASVLTGSTSKSSQVKPIYSSSDGRTTALQWFCMWWGYSQSLTLNAPSVGNAKRALMPRTRRNTPTWCSSAGSTAGAKRPSGPVPRARCRFHLALWFSRACLGK